MSNDNSPRFPDGSDPTATIGIISCMPGTAPDDFTVIHPGTLILRVGPRNVGVVFALGRPWPVNCAAGIVPVIRKSATADTLAGGNTSKIARAFTDGM